MKKQFLTAALGLVSASAVSAQGLYNIGLGDDEAGESLPLRWSVGASVGYDDNASPIGSDCADSDETMYVSGYVQANYVSSTPRATLDVWARLGVIHYLDNIQQTNAATGAVSGSGDDTFPQLRAGVNYTSRISERLRFSSRNWVAYELEPDYDYGFATDRRVGNYLNYSTDNSVGYRISERLGVIGGYRLTGVAYDDLSDNDYQTHTLYAQGRYRLSPSTVATFGGRYSWTDADRGDSDGVTSLTVGLEHRFSPNTVGVIRTGVTLGNSTSPFVEASLNSQVSDRMGVRAFVNYGTADRIRTISTQTCAEYLARTPSSATFEESTTIRVGVQANYTLTPRFTLNGGINYIGTSYEDGRAGAADMDDSLINANIGFNMKLTDLLALTGSYNYTTSDSDSAIQEYDRQRYQIGVSASF